MILVGAQQTASEVERRVIANSALRVVGRLDPAEAARPEYGFLPDGAPPAGHDRQARHDVRAASPSCRCRSWSSSRSRRGPPARRSAADVRALGRHGRPPATRRRPVRRASSPSLGERDEVLHTVRLARRQGAPGRRRLDEHRAVLAEIVGARRRGGGRPRRSSPATCSSPRAPPPRRSRSCFEALLALRATGAEVVVIAGNHDNAAPVRGGPPAVRASSASPCSASVARPDDGGVLALDAAAAASARTSPCCRSAPSATSCAPPS